MYETYEEDPEFRRPNHLAMISLITGLITLFGQVVVVCFWYCGPFLLAIPTTVTLMTGFFGLKQAKRSGGEGREMSIVGLVLGFINLFISLMWILLLFTYVAMVLLIVAMENM